MVFVQERPMLFFVTSSLMIFGRMKPFARLACGLQPGAHNVGIDVEARLIFLGRDPKQSPRCVALCYHGS